MNIQNTHGVTSYSKYYSWIFLKWRHYYEYSKNDVILNEYSKYPWRHFVFKIPMTSPHKYSKCPWHQLLNIQNTHEVISWIFTPTSAFEYSLHVSFWTFKMPMTSLHEYLNTHDLASWIFKITHDGTFWIFKIPIRSLHEYSNTHDQYLNHHITSWIFWIKKKTVVMGILNILNLKLACFCVLSQNHQHFFEI